MCSRLASLMGDQSRGVQIRGRPDWTTKLFGGRIGVLRVMRGSHGFSEDSSDGVCGCVNAEQGGEGHGQVDRFTVSSESSQLKG